MAKPKYYFEEVITRNKTHSNHFGIYEETEVKSPSVNLRYRIATAFYHKNALMIVNALNRSEKKKYE